MGWGATHRKCVQKSPYGRSPRPGLPYPALSQASAATCPALRVSGEPTVATPVPARMGAPASRRMATACVHLDSEAPSARDVRLPVLPLPASSRTWCSARYQMLLPALVSSPDSNLWATYHCGKEGERVGSGLTEGWPCPHHHNPFPPACQPGRYGKRCMPCKCANHSSCHPSDGTCYCLAGWTGPDCSQRTWWLLYLSACAC